ncbi:MAG: hypothetical protein Fur0037_11060 [Planctomycetota bacterium]
MTPTNPRDRLFAAGMGSLWIAAAFPLVLLAVHEISPVAAVSIASEAARWSLRLCLGVTAVFAAGLALLPTVRAGVAFAFSMWLDSVRRNPAPLRKAQMELRHAETAARHFEVGRLAALQGDLRLAATHLSRALEIDPEIDSALFLLGKTAFQAKDFSSAGRILGEVVAKDPNHAFGEALLLLGRCRYVLGDVECAAELLQRHDREQGGNSKSKFWLAQALFAAGRAAAAEEALRAAATPLQGRRETPEERFYRARARVRLWRARGKA